MDVAVDALDESFFTVLAPVVFDLEVELNVIVHVAAFVLPPIAYFTDENLLGATSVVLNVVLDRVQGSYVDFFLLHVLEEL